jgi:hypothetical protein
VFTARYVLSPYIKQIRFVFKGLILVYTSIHTHTHTHTHTYTYTHTHTHKRRDYFPARHDQTIFTCKQATWCNKLWHRADSSQTTPLENENALSRKWGKTFRWTEFVFISKAAKKHKDKGWWWGGARGAIFSQKYHRRFIVTVCNDTVL